MASVERKFDVNNPMQVGGQAVLEGVMMRAPGMVATAVRRANGDIVVKKEPYVSLAERYSALKLPILRGAVGLIEMLVIGTRTLNFSAAIAMKDVQGEHGKNGKRLDDRRNGREKRRENVKLGLTVAFSLLIAVTIFFVTPLVVTTRWFKVEQDPLWFNLISGGIRLLLLMVYLGAISLLKDIRRLFEYHGAEHKAVFAFELGRRLEVSEAARQIRFHPRCGTSFLLIVMFVAIMLFSLLDALLISWLGELNIIIRLATHLPLIPVVGGVSYEFIKFSAKRSKTTLGRIVVAPGLWLQKITTKEPDEKELEVALVALRCALGEDHVITSPVLWYEQRVIALN
jgi:uncharacterized protein YqhQ